MTAVFRMMDAQMHRGPDDWGILIPDEALRDPEVYALIERRGGDHVRTYRRTAVAPQAVLGTRRLAIIDRSPRGRMPMGTRDGRVWITYNGEIYNARELRTELERRGYAFVSESDTEAILHGYEEWGDEVVQRLRGMFAFAILDTADPFRLTLARDRFGIKPLYYHEDGAAIAFASEVRALTRGGLVPDATSVQALVRFLQLGSVPQPLTTVKNVLALPQAHLLSVNSHGGRLERYWDFSMHLPGAQASARDDAADPAGDAAAARAQLEDSVRRHLVSDAPLGIFLSGGIDSSALVALASRFLEKPPTTISLAFEEQAFNEAPYARLVAKRYGTDHRELVVRRRDLFGELPRVLAALDQPTIDGVNSYFVSKAARDAGLTVVLSGTGGDEVFLGYEHFKKAHALERPWRLLGRLPVSLRKGVTALAVQATGFSRRRGLERLTYLGTSSSEDVYLLFRGLFAPHQIQELLGVAEGELDGAGAAAELLDEPIGRFSTPSPTRSLLDATILGEFTHYLPNQLLKDIDFMSMTHSIEARVPYLDHVLVQHVASLPARVKLRASVNKGLLVSALGDDLPSDVWDRPKMGFTLPLDEWLKQQADWLRAMSLDQQLLDPSAVERVWDGFLEGRTRWSQAWALVVLGWFESGRTRGAAT